jgi:hypothetical protein
MIVHKTLERISVCDSPIELGGLLPLPFGIDTEVKVLGVNAGGRLSGMGITNVRDVVKKPIH